MKFVLLALLVTACTSNDLPMVTLVNNPPPEPRVPVRIFLAGEGQTEAQARVGWRLPDDVLVLESPAPRWNASVTNRRDEEDDTGDILALANGAPLVLLGQGNGASMAWRVACAHPTAVRAIVMLAGSANAPDDPSCASIGAVSTLIVHGTLDDIVPYSLAWPTFEQARALAKCADLTEGSVSYDLGVSVETFECDNTDSVGIISAEHWRMIGWEHSTPLPETWWPAIRDWIALRT